MKIVSDRKFSLTGFLCGCAAVFALLISSCSALPTLTAAARPIQATPTAPVFWPSTTSLPQATLSPVVATTPAPSATTWYYLPPATDTPIPQPSPTIDASQFQIYTDPDGQYTLLLPASWRPGAEAGAFYGPDGTYFRTGYLPEMGFMGSVDRVCFYLANVAQGPVARGVAFGFLDALPSCTVGPLPETGVDRARWVFMNPSGDPEHRFFYLESDTAHLQDLVQTVRLMHPSSLTGPSAYPSGPLRPEDEAFWGTVRTPSADLTTEEYALVADVQASPRLDMLFAQVPPDVLLKRAQWRNLSTRANQLERINAQLEPFGYALRVDNAAALESYSIYRGETLVKSGILEFSSFSVSAAGKDFAFLVNVANDGYWLIQNGQMAIFSDWGVEGGPLFVGEDLVSAFWVPGQQQIQVRKGSQVLFAVSDLFGANSGVQSLHSWNGHWLLEVRGFLFEDGANLNEMLGYDEIFGWQLLNGKPFYYFRKGPRVGISYDGQVQPVGFDDIYHDGCCGFAVNNNGGNPAMVWFNALREGMWYYVEIGHYES